MEPKKLAMLIVSVAALSATCAGQSPEPWRLYLPEEEAIRVRCEEALCEARIPTSPRPTTVAQYPSEIVPWQMSLDEAICIALRNATVVRVLSGASAGSSGRTIYDPAISSTQIDVARARFDPTVQVLNTWSQTDVPSAIFDPLDPTRARIVGFGTQNYNANVGVGKTTANGGQASFGLNATTSINESGTSPLNHQTQAASSLGYTQPLWQGGGVRVNQVPIVVARINTERSYFQFKDSIQELARGVIEGYWGLVFARTDVWARGQQVTQGEEALKQSEAKLRSGLGDLARVAQARSALANFKANLITSRANLLLREQALRNVLGLPPFDGRMIVPITPPTTNRVSVDWDELVRLAEVRRPDLIELKLVLEADQELLVLARNSANPRLDAVGLYRWNGLEGRMPNGQLLNAASDGAFGDWQLGVNFSVPFGLRQARANERSQQLLIARDRANLHQGLHQVGHTLAINLRNLEQLYEQYKAFGEVREAARLNLERQFADFRSGRPTLYLNVLQAISDWGNAVSAESQSLTLYNAQLAAIERQSGTILETHGIRLFEERFEAVGPLGPLVADHLYPRDIRPGTNSDRYPVGTKPSEESFDLKPPVEFEANPKPRPYPPVDEDTNDKPDGDGAAPAKPGPAGGNAPGNIGTPPNGTIPMSSRRGRIQEGPVLHLHSAPVAGLPGPRLRRMPPASQPQPQRRMAAGGRERR